MNHIEPLSMHTPLNYLTSRCIHILQRSYTSVRIFFNAFEDKDNHVYWIPLGFTLMIYALFREGAFRSLFTCFIPSLTFYMIGFNEIYVFFLKRNCKGLPSILYSRYFLRIMAYRPPYISLMHCKV